MSGKLFKGGSPSAFSTKTPMQINGNAQAPTGSISGFSGLTLADGTIITESNFSVSQLFSYLQNLDAQYSLTRLQSIESMVQSHIYNYNNPHKVTFSDLAGNSFSSFFESFVPGTTPLDYPLLAVEASYEEFSSQFSNITTSRSTPMFVLDRQGFVKQVPAKTPGVDWQNGFPVIPCWGARTQYLPSLDYLNNSFVSFLGAEANLSTNTAIIPVQSFSDTISLTETSTSSLFGCSITMNNLTAGNNYTFSTFIYVQKTFGSIVIYTQDNEAVVFDIATASYVVSSNNVIGYIYPLPNGWWRIGIQFIGSTAETISIIYTPSVCTGPQNAVISNFIPTQSGSGNQFTQEYTGTLGVPIMCLSGPQVTNGAGVAPFITTGSLQASVITFPAYENATASITGMGVLRYVNANAVGHSTTHTLIASPSNFSISETQYFNDNSYTYNRSSSISIDVTNPASVVTGTYTENTLGTNNDPTNVIYIGYNPSDEFSSIGWSFNTSKITIASSYFNRSNLLPNSNNYNSLPAMTSFSVGSFDGGINSFEYYSVSDDSNALDFLIGQNVTTV